MKRRHLVLVVLPILLVLTLVVLLPASAQASPTIAQKRAEATRIKGEIDALDVDLEMAIEQYNAATIKLDEVQTRVADNERQLELAQENLTAGRLMLAARAESIYKEHTTDVLDVLLQTKSFDDFVTQLDLFQRISENDSAAVDRIEGLKSEIAKRRQMLLADQKEAKQLVAQRTATKARITSSLAQRKNMLKGVEGEIARLEEAQRRAARLAAQQAAAAAAAAAQNGYSAPDLPAGAGGASTSAGAHPQVIAIAQQQLGKPYVYAGAGPNVFDCSGLTMYCYAQIGISLPHNAAMQYACTTHIARSSAQPGDLVYFGYSAASIHHVAIYIGNGTMIHAPHTGAVVCYQQIDYSGDLYGFSRP